MNKWILGSLIISATALILPITTHQIMAQNRNFSNVVPFSTSAGRLGFFDQGDGKIYIYDNNLSECIFKGQLDELGKPLRKFPVDSVLETSGSPKENGPTSSL